MTETRLWERVLFWAGLLLAWMIWFAAAQAHATPIRPDVRRMLDDQHSQTQFIPARAGWHGPETPAADRPSPMLDTAATTRVVRASILAAAVPDPRAILAIAACIFLLRWLRPRRSKQLGPQLVRGEFAESLPDVKRAA